MGSKWREYKSENPKCSKTGSLGGERHTQRSLLILVYRTCLASQWLMKASLSGRQDDWPPKNTLTDNLEWYCLSLLLYFSAMRPNFLTVYCSLSLSLFEDFGYSNIKWHYKAPCVQYSDNALWEFGRWIPFFCLRNKSSHGLQLL